MAPPKRQSNRLAGATRSATPKGNVKPKATQSTLAFHGAGGIRKPGAAEPGKDVKDKNAEELSVEVAEPEKEVTEPEEEVATPVELEVESPAVAPEADPTLPPEEAAARAVTDAQIKEFWEGKEKERRAPRVHQEGLSVEEKLCRQWDTDARYGPCMGISRIKRWRRAHGLGLDPPIEVYAILLREQKADKQAYVDKLMSPRAGEEP
ncbi:hypothetical protein EJ06DRAFT_483324 [Trichodelitschia bisporula]|uniref:DNA polymerase delta subunit 4 n=1 Tax=Trichodelitschia bisporula TaxID=703511 RepID=A0A6G1HLF2_9PEZI|nr:hypothetical protein EJ06DRAFT_483324 [Trichodelitschia bisporula]